MILNHFLIRQSSLFYAVILLCCSTASEGGGVGQNQIQESEIGKYKEYEGILFPTIKTQSFGPQSIEMILNKVILNSKFNDEVFN